jgi:hypothetical protein
MTAFFKYREFTVKETSGGASKEQRIQTAYQTQWPVSIEDERCKKLTHSY